MFVAEGSESVLEGGSLPCEGVLLMGDFGECHGQHSRLISEFVLDSLEFFLVVLGFLLQFLVVLLHHLGTLLLEFVPFLGVPGLLFFPLHLVVVLYLGYLVGNTALHLALLAVVILPGFLQFPLQVAQFRIECSLLSQQFGVPVSLVLSEFVLKLLDGVNEVLFGFLFLCFLVG
jgi:hypothetical protein